MNLEKERWYWTGLNPVWIMMVIAGVILVTVGLLIP